MCVCVYVCVYMYIWMVWPLLLKSNILGHVFLFQKTTRVHVFSACVPRVFVSVTYVYVVCARGSCMTMYSGVCMSMYSGVCMCMYYGVCTCMYSGVCMI